MPKNVSNNSQDNYDFSMKHRLVGAAILISFAVLVLPWILGPSSEEDRVIALESSVNKTTVNINDEKVEGKPDKKINPNIVEADENVEVFVSRVQPVDVGDIANKETVKNNNKPTTPLQPKETVKPIDEVKVEKVVKTQPKPKAKKEVKDKPKTAPKPIKKQTPKVKRGYIVSVGVFGDSKNAGNLVNTLSGKGFSPLTRKESFKGKQVTRIYLGPFATRSEAGKMKLRLFEQQKIPSLVKEFP